MRLKSPAKSHLVSVSGLRVHMCWRKCAFSTRHVGIVDSSNVVDMVHIMTLAEIEKRLMEIASIYPVLALVIRPLGLIPLDFDSCPRGA